MELSFIGEWWNWRGKGAFKKKNSELGFWYIKFAMFVRHCRENMEWAEGSVQLEFRERFLLEKKLEVIGM